MELLYRTAVEPTPEQVEAWKRAEREWSLRFRLSPLEVVPSGGGVRGVRFGINRIEDGKAVLTDDSEFLDCGLVLRSIGYTSLRIDPSIPFNEELGIIPNDRGKVTGHQGLYVSGWVGTGPVGVLLSTMQSGFATAERILADIESGVVDASEKKEGKVRMIQLLAEKRISLPVTFHDWTSLDQFEMEEGKKLGKPREKITDTNKMIEIALGDN